MLTIQYVAFVYVPAYRAQCSLNLNQQATCLVSPPHSIREVAGVTDLFGKLAGLCSSLALAATFGIGFRRLTYFDRLLLPLSIVLAGLVAFSAPVPVEAFLTVVWD